jgi:hypothetical protein
MQLVGMLSGIAVLLLVAIIAMRLTPASADPPCDSNVEMLEGGVETHVHRVPLTPLSSPPTHASLALLYAAFLSHNDFCFLLLE